MSMCGKKWIDLGVCISLKETWKLKDWKRGEIYAFCEKLKTNYEIFVFIDNIKWRFLFYQNISHQKYRGGSSFPCVVNFSRMLLQSFWILKRKGYIRILSPCVGLLHPNWSKITILASDWSMLVKWPEYWPLIGQMWQSFPLIGSHQI